MFKLIKRLYRSGHCCVAVNRNLNDWELEEFENFLSMMACVHLRDTPDTLIWKLSKNGKSSINSFYNKIAGFWDLNNSDQQLSFPFKAIWKTMAPPQDCFLFMGSG